MSVAGCLRGLAIVAVHCKQFAVAAGLFGAAEALREQIGLPAPRHHQQYEHAVQNCRVALGEELFLVLWGEGREMPWGAAKSMAAGVGRIETTGDKDQTLQGLRHAGSPESVTLDSRSIS
jgi:hypothetical protein